MMKETAQMSPIGKWEGKPGVKRKIMQPGKELMMMEVHFLRKGHGDMSIITSMNRCPIA